MRSWAAWRCIAAGLAFAALALAPAAAVPGSDPSAPVAADTQDVAGLADPRQLGAVLDDPNGQVAPVLQPDEPPARDSPPDDGATPGFADRIRSSFGDELMLASLATATVAGVGLLGVGLVTRYISPKEALKNPQRAMLYGFVRGNPGVHLKRLSEEFHMKTSSILWHVRKLESAELVRSERSNGFRVFYPTAGGVEVRNVGRGVTALQNANAHHLFAALLREPGAPTARLAAELKMPVGTARWHLKKLKDFGLVDEVPGPEGARYLPTPLGQRAFASLSSPGHLPAAAAHASPVTA